jgi:hypothetical protein
VSAANPLTRPPMVAVISIRFMDEPTGKILATFADSKLWFWRSMMKA